MKYPSSGIPETLKEQDPILTGFLEVLDETYESAYKELSKGLDLNDVDKVPDSYLDFLLFENGIALFEGYSAIQKRALLQNILELDSKRYTKDGLSLFVDSILPALYVDVEVPLSLNAISFRSPAIGFPNTNQRQTAGRVVGDVNPYIIGRTLNREVKIFFFSSDGTDYPNADTLRFLNQVVPTELPDLTPDLSYAFINYIKSPNTVELRKLPTNFDAYKEQVEADGGTVEDEEATREMFYESEADEYYVVEGTNTSFTTEFSVGEFIGLYSPSNDRVYSYQIVEIIDDLELRLSPFGNTDPIPKDTETVEYYKPE